MDNDIKWLPLGYILINDTIMARMSTVNHLSNLVTNGMLRIFTDYPANEQEDIVDDILTNLTDQIAKEPFNINLDIVSYSYNDTMKCWIFKYKVL